MKKSLRRAEEIAHVLTKQGWLSRQPSTFQGDVLARGFAQDFEPGEAVYRVGDACGGIYGLVAGTLAVSIAAPGRTPRFVQFGSVGAWAGEGCFMTGETRRAELRTVSECTLFHLPLDAMQRLATDDPEAIRYFARITVNHYDVMARVIDDLLIPKAECRIAAALERASWLLEPTVQISQSDLGAMANASRSQVNAALARFAREGWLSHSYRSITIHDAKALYEFAQGSDIGR